MIEIATAVGVYRIKNRDNIFVELNGMVKIIRVFGIKVFVVFKENGTE
jgi:hypothetical protein